MLLRCKAFFMEAHTSPELCFCQYHTHTAGKNKTTECESTKQLKHCGWSCRKVLDLSGRMRCGRNLHKPQEAWEVSGSCQPCRQCGVGRCKPSKFPEGSGGATNPETNVGSVSSGGLYLKRAKRSAKTGQLNSRAGQSTTLSGARGGKPQEETVVT